MTDSEKQTPEVKGAGSNPHTEALVRRFQAAVSTMLVAVLIWVGMTVQDTAVAVARLEVQVEALQNSRELVHVERRLDQHDDRLENVTSRLRTVEAKVHND